MRPVVVYQSKYGSTKQYAQWLAEALSCRLYEAEKMNAENLAEYDTVIYGGGIYAGAINGIEMLKKSCRFLCDKNIILFTCGIADPKLPANAAQIQESINRILPDDLKKKQEYFTCAASSIMQNCTLPIE